jgi:hypothetical protein
MCCIAGKEMVSSLGGQQRFIETPQDVSVVEHGTVILK